MHNQGKRCRDDFSALNQSSTERQPPKIRRRLLKKFDRVAVLTDLFVKVHLIVLRNVLGLADFNYWCLL